MVEQSFQPMGAKIEKQGGNFVLTIPAEMLSDQLLQQLSDWVKVLNLIHKTHMTEEAARELSEMLKESWWNANRKALLERILAT